MQWRRMAQAVVQLSWYVTWIRFCAACPATQCPAVGCAAVNTNSCFHGVGHRDCDVLRYTRMGQSGVPLSSDVRTAGSSHGHQWLRSTRCGIPISIACLRCVLRDNCCWCHCTCRCGGGGFSSEGAGGQ